MLEQRGFRYCNPLGVDVRWIRTVFFFLCLTATICQTGSSQLVPKVRGVGAIKNEFLEGTDALLTCAVDNVGGNTVLWSRISDGKKKVLSIDNIRVVQDHRIKVLHDEAPSRNGTVKAKGGNVWVLSIKNISKADAGGYLCRVGSTPPVQTYYMVSVKTLSEVKADLSEKLSRQTSHNYTECCVKNGVSDKCLSFCNINNILDGTAGTEPEECESEFSTIVKCMADFRNHVPCCEKQGIPDICQDLCRGEYTEQNDYVKSHFSCSAYTEATLMCISKGIEIIPRAPHGLTAQVLGPTQVNVKWFQLEGTSPEHDSFLINVTTIRKFDPPIDAADSSSSKNTTDLTELDGGEDIQFIFPKKMQVKVPGNVTSFVLDTLSPLTWYEISVISSNKHGSSLPLYKLRVLTWEKHQDTQGPVHPQLPDVAGCCIEKGVKHQGCITKMCNPYNKYIEQADMVVCAVWSKETYSCLTGGRDNSACCRQRGLPDKCIELCSGNVTKINYSYFKCSEHYSDMRSCLMQGYGVLPGAPQNIQVSNVEDTFALLSWEPPELNKNSVTSYNVFFRALEPSRECLNEQDKMQLLSKYRGIYSKMSPVVMEGLCPNTEYEIYSQAFNKHGTSEASDRLLFRTKERIDRRPDTALQPYNSTECCRAINLSPACLVLCSYDVRMSHFLALSNQCTAEMPHVLRCVVGGRNHSACCKRRGVPSTCRSLCTGTFSGSDSSPTGCLPYIGNVMLCLEDGVGTLPGPVISLHATSITNDEVTLQWDAPEEGAEVTGYQVNYQAVDKFSATHALFRLNNTMNVTKPYAVINNLTYKGLYNFYVVSVNDHGISLPSSILTLNISSDTSPGVAVAGVPSAPHSLLLESKSATTLMVVWQPPIVALPTERFRFDLFYAPLPSGNSTPEFNMSSTSSTVLKLKDLTPNTQYIIYLQATSDMGKSRPSETLLAWTDPAYPAFVETPTVHPSNMIIEGRSMTVLCIAMGSPPPKVSLYISGKKAYENVTRHMVTVVHNVTRNMTEISCYADNGYGTPMQSSVTIDVAHRPIIEAREEVGAAKGTPVALTCSVSAWPQPSMLWWSDPEQRVAVINGGNVSLDNKIKGKGQYIMKLTLRHAQDATYYCHASNPQGEFTHAVKVVTWENVRNPIDVSACCSAKNVSVVCLKSCDFDQIDFHTYMNREACIPDFPKLFECGSDGSDHRGCCHRKRVPENCLDWCRGKIDDPQDTDCLLSWAPAIFECFNEGKGILPGPPLNVKVLSLSENAARVSWDPPVKNPYAVELYRVFWREKGTLKANKSDTPHTSMILRPLKKHTEYEIAVKAGNIRGTSVLTDVQVFVMNMPYVSHTASSHSRMGISLGISVTVIAILAFLILFWYVFKKRKTSTKATSGISFENPSYVREQSGDAVQIAETPNGSFGGSITDPPPIGANGTHTPGVPTDHSISNGVWNTSQGPGFDSDLDPKVGYKRFKS